MSAGYRRSSAMRTIEEGLDIFSTKLPFRCQNSRSDVLDVAAAMHVHRAIEIVTLYSGQMIFEFEKETVLLKAGTILIIDSYVPHQSTDQGPQIINMNIIQFETDLFLSEYRSLEISSSSAANAGFRVLRPGESPLYRRIDATIRDLALEMEEKKTGYVLYAKAKLYELIALLARNDIFRLTEFDDSGINEYWVKTILDITKYLEAHLAEPITLQSVSVQYKISYSHLSRIFKKVTGQNFIQYLNRLRVIRAQQMLIESTYSITEIVERTGFSSLNYLNRIFKRFYNYSPSEYRKHILIHNIVD